jgi:hypothetical protein
MVLFSTIFTQNNTFLGPPPKRQCLLAPPWRMPLPPRPGRRGSLRWVFFAHLDTSDDAPGAGVKPQVVEKYDGGRIGLADGLVLDPDADPGLADQKGKTIIHTDGTTLLGADDTAGIAEIMTTVWNFCASRS